MQGNFEVRFYGTTCVRSYPVSEHFNQLLELANTPEQIEMLISEYESQLAQLDHETNEFLICDTAAELMADVLRSKGIECQVICGINDEGQSHSYVRVGEKNYDPTYQGFGENYTEDEKA